jgi:hypothetical protein
VDAARRARLRTEVIPEYERVLRFNPNHTAARYGLARKWSTPSNGWPARDQGRLLRSWLFSKVSTCQNG